MLLIQALPLIVLVLLLAHGRAGPVPSCLLAMLSALPAIALAVGGLAGMPDFLLARSAEAGWLATGPMGIVLGGLLFHAASRPRQQGEAPADPGQAIFIAAFLLGPFAESVTGFGVGLVFAVGALRQAGLSGSPAAALSLLAVSLIPWGGLGPGTAVGAALAEVPAAAIAWRNAIPAAVWLLGLLPLFWRLCAAAGRPVPWAARPAQLAWVAAAGGLLVLCNAFLAWEVAGILATGPLCAAALLRAHPPRDARAWRAALAAAFPYLLLTAVLIGLRGWTGAPALRPFAGLPPLGLGHPMVGLWLVALGLLAGFPHGRGAARAAVARGVRPVLALLLYVVLARWLVGAGVPAALAGALRDAMGGAAPFAAPVMAGLSGFFAGTNVGANAAMMPLQAALGRLYGLEPCLLPGVQNFVGAACIMLAPQIVALAAGLTGGGAAPRAIWRLAWPAVPLALGIGMICVALG